MTGDLECSKEEHEKTELSIRRQTLQIRLVGSVV